MSDPYLSNVSLLLLANGDEGATGLTDSGPLGLPVTAANGAHISTVSPAVGTGSLVLNSTTNDYLTVPASAAFDFGSQTATIEFYIRISGPVLSESCIVDYAEPSTSDFLDGNAQGTRPGSMCPKLTHPRGSGDSAPTASLLTAYRRKKILNGQKFKPE